MRSPALLVLLFSGLSFLAGCQSEGSSGSAKTAEAGTNQNTGPTVEEVEVFLNESDAIINKDSAGAINIVNLEGTEIHGEDLAKLKVLKGLRRLYLDKTTTDAGMVHVKELKGLLRLELVGADVTDEGIKHISELPELTHLDLSKTRVTDNGLKLISQLTRLKSLGLSDTAVSNRGMEYIKGLERLIVLDVTDTDVSVEASIDLKKTLTGLSVRR